MAKLIDYRCGLTIEPDEEGDCPHCYLPPLPEPQPAESDGHPSGGHGSEQAGATAGSRAVGTSLCSACGSMPAVRGGRCDICADAEPPSGYTLVLNGHSTCIDDALIIGRDPEYSPLFAADLARYDDVSRRHGRVTARTNGVSFEDLGSRNGSFLNDTPLKPFVATTLLPGDHLRLGADCILTIERS